MSGLYPNTFGTTSQAELATCDDRLQRVMEAAIQHIDFSVLEGHRGQADQDRAVAEGNSKTPWPGSKHNSVPSLAVDIAPYPVDWSDTPKARERFVYLAGVVMTCAKQLGIRLRWGGDWNGNDDMRDEPAFRDYPHFEIIP